MVSHIPKTDNFIWPIDGMLTCLTTLDQRVRIMNPKNCKLTTGCCDIPEILMEYNMHICDSDRELMKLSLFIDFNGMSIYLGLFHA